MSSKRIVVGVRLSEAERHRLDQLCEWYRGGEDERDVSRSEAVRRALDSTYNIMRPVETGRQFNEK